MTKHDLALKISREMYKKGSGRWESFKAFQCIQSYLLTLSIDDLSGIANQYGIEV